MELHQLRYALAVMKTGNFSRAAVHCHVSQPSLSQQIQKLEDELGERLFTRLKRNAVPTDAGRAFLARAERVFGELEAASREVRDQAALLQGRVRIGVLPTIAPYLLPELFATFNRQYPAVEMIVQETVTSQLVELCAGCELDVAILSLPIVDSRLGREVLFSEELLLAVPPGHHLSGRRNVRLSDLEQERFILLQEGHCLGDQALRFCDQQNLRPVVVFRAAQIETILGLVAAGCGVSLVPEMARSRIRERQPAYVPLANPRPSRSIGVVWRREQQHSRAASALLDALRCFARSRVASV